MEMILRFGGGDDAVVVDMPLTKKVRGYKEPRDFSLGSKFRTAYSGRHEFTVVGVGTESGVCTLDIR